MGSVFRGAYSHFVIIRCKLLLQKFVFYFFNKWDTVSDYLKQLRASHDYIHAKGIKWHK